LYVKGTGAAVTQRGGLYATLIVVIMLIKLFN
jgi:hypothetical protein